jgi:hypothetical protein
MRSDTVKRQQKTHRGELELDEFWCSDCLAASLFERLHDDVASSEWACTACGAAYFDAIDLVVDPILATAGVA